MEIDCPNHETCGGELTFRIYQDADGDAGGMYGIRTWTAAECTDQTCACEFDDKTWQRLEATAIEASANTDPWEVD